MSFVKCGFGVYFLLTSMKAGLDLACFVEQVVKMLSVLALRRVCYHLNFCMELVCW